MKKSISLSLTAIMMCIMLSLTSCSSLMGSLTDSMTKSLFGQKDIQLLEDGGPAFLLIIEALADRDPKNKDMLITAMQAFSAYSTAFVDDKERSAIFLQKSKNWAFACLMNYPNFAKYTNSSDKEIKDAALDKFIAGIKKKDVPYVFWSAYSWALWIMANLDSMEAFIDLPVAKRIIERVGEIDGDFYYGAPHLFLGVYFASYPENFGGDMNRAKSEFDYALNLAGDKMLTSKLLYANTYLKTKGEKEEYRKIMEEVIAADIEQYPETRLLNVITQQNAEKMLDKIDETFLMFDFD
ncbi:MAG: hypothetical protein II707_01195 [Spirochaetales bacterium]|nr:hypothetical protein [Spirochaetales bacterium]